MYNKPLVCQNLKPKNKSSVRFAHTPLTVAVLLASAVIGMTSQNVFAGSPDDWPETLAELIADGILVSNGEDGGQVYYNRDLGKDPVDNSFGWIWGKGTNTPSILNVTVTKTQDWQQIGGKVVDGELVGGKFLDKSEEKDGVRTQTTIWIAGGITSSFGSTLPWGLVKASDPFSSTASGNTLNFTLNEGQTFLAKFFGGRNDLGGGAGETFLAEEGAESAGNANYNTVNVNLGKQSTLYAKLIFGGRSSQLDAINGSTVTENGKKITAVHKGFQTNYNKIKIQGFIDGEAKDLVTASVDKNGKVTSQDKNYGNSSLLITKGVFGAEGYEANNNMVVVNNTVLVAGMPAARKLGLVGGRGDYYQRINQLELPNGSGGTVTNTSLIWDRNGLAEQSAYANNNVVIVDNSYIGFRVPIANNDWDLWTSPGNSWLKQSSNSTSNPEHAFSIYGGWSIGEAKDNIVSLKNSVVNGNVIGGYELLNRADASKDDMRNLNANLVSLFNTKLTKGSSVYGTATGTGVAEIARDDKGNIKFVRLSESSLQAVNRRRGVVYFAGENEADSVWARYVHFGQYVDNDVLEADPGVERNITRDYYPTSENYQSVLNDPNYKVSDSAALKRITSSNLDANQYSMRLGDLVAKTYVVNRTGFHSSLSSQDHDNVSTVTDGLHNFWVGTYVNLVSGVDGDGRLFNKDRDLFANKTTYQVNHSYGSGTTSAGQNLSLLVHDDGMVYSFEPNATTSGTSKDENATHRPALMHQFRYHYDGLVLYVGVNNGLDPNDPNKEINAVEVSFEAIQDFREDREGVDAFGNTFVGVFLEGNPHPFFLDSTKAGLNTVDAKLMTFEPLQDDGRPGFEIYQKDQEGKSVVVADATYGIYKYLHFDGEDVTINDKNSAGENYTAKVTEEGKSGGIGIKYWLKSLDIRDGQLLTLNGITSTDDLGETKNIAVQERYTLSAELTGRGGILIPEDNIVVLGTPKTIYNIIVDDYAPDKEVAFSAPIPNSYTGATFVKSGATLAAGIDGALGSETSYTESLQLEEGKSQKTGFYLQGHTQVVGQLIVEKNAVLSLTEAAPIVTSADQKDPYKANLGIKDGKLTGGELTVRDGATVSGNVKGSDESLINVEGHSINILSDNTDFLGTVFLKNNASGLLNNSKALENATANVAKGSQLFFLTAPSQVTTRSVGTGTATIGSIVNSGEVFLSNGNLGPKTDSLNVVDVQKNYAGTSGSVIHYRGLVQGPNNSQVDVVRSQTATGTSEITFGDHKDLPPVGVFAQSQGEKTLKENGIPVFIVQKPTHDANDLTLTMQEFGVKAKDNEAYKWMYGLGYNEKEDGSREWVLYNSNTPDDEPTPIIPPSPSVDPDLPNVPVLRPESGAYIANSEAWAKMHMRLHDRFGQAYYIDPFDGEEKKAAGWVRQVGTHSHFKAGSSKTHARTAITQVGADLIRNEANEDWKYVGGVFAGGLYNRANTRSWDSAKSRSDGYSLGIYGTIYTGNSPDDGFYVDSWLLFGRYDNKVWGDENPGFKYKSRGWVWSVESGYTIPLSESGTKDYNKLIWTFQPEVQVVWDGVRASSVVDNTGTKYTQLGKDNVSIRVGARLHANYMNKGLGFIEGNWIHNTKNPGVRMTNGDIYRNGGRNVGEFRMGLEGHLSRNTLGWATVGVQAGKSGYHNETAQIGLRYMF